MQIVDENELDVWIRPDTLIRADCLKAMQFIPDHSVDLILCDLPFEVTANKWDVAIDSSWMWREYERVLILGKAVVLNAIQPFTSILVNSKPDWFKYEWIWEKNISTNHLNVETQPLRIHESILIFINGSSFYHPLYGRGRPYLISKGKDTTPNYRKQRAYKQQRGSERFPTSIIRYAHDHPRLHPTQKPVSLFEYLIRTYTQEGDVVLDNTAGVMTTAVAAIRCNRHYVCIEQSKEYFDLGVKRVEQEEMRIRML